MAIRIEDSPEPLSERSLRPGAGPLLLVEAEATRVLQQELQRYCEGNIAGRSFLIAGHRGAGKTTLVHKAFLDTWQACERKSEFLRPLLIALHGPSLFPPAKPEPPPAKPPAAKPSAVHWTVAASSEAGKPPAATEGKAGAAKSSAAPAPARAAESESADGEKSEAQIALEQITLGLHRAVTKEFVHRYYERASDLAYLRRQEASVRKHLEELQSTGQMAWPTVAYPTPVDLDRLLRALPPDRELGALAARLEIELHEGPSPQRLHELWARLESVSGGVLFTEGYAPIMRDIPPGTLAQLPPGLRYDLPSVHGQGLRELVALSGVVEAYRRISGAVSRTDTQGDKRSQSEQRDSGFELGAKELVVPIVSLLTGAVAGVGAAAAGGGGFAAVVTGVVTALVSGLVLKVSKTRKRDRTAERAESFIPDLTVATLDRVLPLLIDRLREAGLAPVFVVDELDKIEGLSTRILAMVKHLKKLVSENAFFCFLANRSYFEEMQSAGAGQAYPIEYTYYTHHLFVVFSPEDFERYLHRRIPDPLPATPSGTAGPSEQESDEANACALLRWVLRHRAQLHMVDLQREIAALRGEGGVVTADLKQLVSSPRNRIEATMQVAIELRAADAQVQQVLATRPDLRRLLNDAMYYLTRRWLANAESVELTPKDRWPRDAEGKPEPPQCFRDFVDYLERRTGRQEEQAGGAGEAEGDETAAVKKPSRGVKSNSEFLYEQVGLLADFLSDRPAAPEGGAGAPAIALTGTGGTAPDWRRDARERWNEHRDRRQLPRVDGSFWDSLLLRGTDSPIPDSVLVRDPRPDCWGYRFRYDAVSATPRPAAPATAAHATVPSVADPLAAAADEAEAGGVPPKKRERGVVVDPQVLDSIDLIAAYASMLDRLQREPGAPAAAEPLAKDLTAVNLGTLASPYALISPSPAWSVVEAAAARLLDARGRGARYSTQAEDELYVVQFRELLVRNAPRIARALACAAFVGRGTSTSRGPRLARGLAVISRAYAFAQRDEEAVRTTLEDVVAQVRAVFQVNVEPEPVTVESAADIARYEQAVAAAIGEAEGFHGDGFERVFAEVEDRAWSDLIGRLERWITTGSPGSPEVVELVAAARKRGPSIVLLRFDPREMTIADWMRVLAGARRGTASTQSPATPAWLAPIALHALGFVAVPFGSFAGQRWLRWPEQPDVGTRDGERWSRVQALVKPGGLFTGPSSTTTVVVIRRTVSPQLVTWLPIRSLATLIATVDELGAILEDASDVPSLPLLAATDQQVVAVEMDPELPSRLENELYPVLASSLRVPWLVHVYWQDRGREMRHPYVVNPTTLEQIVDAAAKERVPLPSKA